MKLNLLAGFRSRSRLAPTGASVEQHGAFVCWHQSPEPDPIRARWRGDRVLFEGDVFDVLADEQGEALRWFARSTW